MRFVNSFAGLLAVTNVALAHVQGLQSNSSEVYSFDIPLDGTAWPEEEHVNKFNRSILARWGLDRPWTPGKPLPDNGDTGMKHTVKFSAQQPEYHRCRNPLLKNPNNEELIFPESVEEDFQVALDAFVDLCGLRDIEMQDIMVVQPRSAKAIVVGNDMVYMCSEQSALEVGQTDILVPTDYRDHYDAFCRKDELIQSV
jgi:hypothetical protein